MDELAQKIEQLTKYLIWGTVKMISPCKKSPSLPLNFSSVNSILIIRSDRLGDVILSTPIYETIKKSFPHIMISALVSQTHAPILADNPNIEEIIFY